MSVAKPEMPRVMPEQIENPHSSSFRPSDVARPPVFHSEAEVQRVGAAFPCALGVTRPVFCKMLADRTQGPLMGSRLIPEHRDIPRCPPRPSLGHHPIAIKI